MKLKKDDEIKIFGPMGNFILDKNEMTPKVFIAAGISITPYYSMLQYAAQKKIKNPLTLLVSFSSPEEMIFYNELKKIEEKNETIKVIYTITGSRKLQQWDGEQGRISEALIKKHISETSNS